MKFKMSKRILAAALAMVLMVGVVGVSALAEEIREANLPTVIFDAGAKQFYFKNMPLETEGADLTDAENITVSENNPRNTYPDLFLNFKNLFPGDQVSQQIVVKVVNAGSTKWKIMLKSDNADEDCATLLGYEVEAPAPAETEEPDSEEAAPTVTEPVDWVGPVKSEYPAVLTATFDVYNKTGNMVQTFKEKIKAVLGVDNAGSTTATYTGTMGAEGVYLGLFSRSDDKRTIDVTIDIPIKAGNELQGLCAHLDWVFLAEKVSSGGGGEDIPDEPVPGADLNTTDHYAYIIGRDDGLVHPEASITRGEVATIFFRMLTDESRTALWSQTNAYADVAPNMWCNAAISTMSNGGIIKGYPDGTFRPNAPITRAEFATMAARFFDEECEVKDVFSDVAGHWAEEYINRAATVGIINGYPDGTFGPDRSITRAEAITIFNRVLGRAPVKDHLLDEMIKWPDNMDTGAWYYADMQEATNSHDYDTEMSGDGVTYEIWTKLLPVRDWAAFEREWANSNAAANPGEVVSSANATK